MKSNLNDILYRKGNQDMGYKKIDFSNFNFEDKPITTEEALKNIKPLEIPQDVIDGNKEIVVSGIQEYSGSRVKVKVNYV